MSDLRTCPTCEGTILHKEATFCSQCGLPVTGIETINGYVLDSIGFEETSKYVLPDGLKDKMTPVDRAYLVNEKRRPRYQSVASTPVLGWGVSFVYTALNMLTAGKVGDFAFGDAYVVLARADELTEGEWAEFDALPLDRFEPDACWRLVGEYWGGRP